ncbi:MAG: 50S ribosomal protein L3 [Chloroflexi bacterium RBG_16_50_11]|nr:MAG: 50S ribosomal protein L3 [Chloroflexi bacterium RBG_16_50_11]
MTLGILGKKLGMTQTYGKGGKTEAITAIEAGPCTIMQVKTAEKDGYTAVQLGFGEVKKQKTGGKKGKAKEKEPVKFKYRREFRTDNGPKVEAGQKIDVSLFKAGDIVDVSGISKGKGFAGGVKRYHFRGGPKTHGQSDRWRAPGSVGSNTSPGRVYKGLRMAGHLGDAHVTVSNLVVSEVDPARNLLLIKGAVPGMTNGLVMIQKSKREKK